MNGFDLLTFVVWWVASVSGTAAGSIDGTHGSGPQIVSYTFYFA
jgi:hypothetical protein